MEWPLTDQAAPGRGGNFLPQLGLQVPGRDRPEGSPCWPPDSTGKESPFVNFHNINAHT